MVFLLFQNNATVKAPSPILGNGESAMNWQMIGYMMVIYIAAIQNISEDVVEAALIDGVNRRQMITERSSCLLIMPRNYDLSV